MKNLKINLIYVFSIIMISTLLFTSCKKETPEPTPDFKITELDIDIKNFGDAVIPVESINSELINELVLYYYAQDMNYTNNTEFRFINSELHVNHVESFSLTEAPCPWKSKNVYSKEQAKELLAEIFGEGIDVDVKFRVGRFSATISWRTHGC